MSRIQQLTWLRRSKRWPRFQRFWKPIKVLGAGTSGLCGLWGNTERSRKFPDYLVVKQDRNRHGSHAESKFLRQLMQRDAEHIIKIYRATHAIEGSGTSIYKDPKGLNDNNLPIPNGLVYRIYLE